MVTSEVKMRSKIYHYIFKEGLQLFSFFSPVKLREIQATGDEKLYSLVWCFCKPNQVVYLPKPHQTLTTAMSHSQQIMLSCQLLVIGAPGENNLCVVLDYTWSNHLFGHLIGHIPKTQEPTFPIMLLNNIFQSTYLQF